MQELGKALKVSIYITDGETCYGAARSSTLLDFLFYRGVSGATALKGVAGFGANHHMHTASVVAVSDRLPIKVEFVETPTKVEELLPKLRELCVTGMIEVQETTVYKAILGYGSGKHVHQRHVFSEGASLMLTIIDAEEKIRGFMSVLDKMMPNGLVVLSGVDIITYRYGSPLQSVSAKEMTGA